MQALTWDIGCGAVLALLVAYTVLIRRHKSLATLVSVYIAYFVATAWGERFSALLSGDQVLLHSVWIRAHASPELVQSLLLIIFTFVISAFLKLGGKRSRYGTFEIVTYAICTVAVGSVFVLLFLPDAMRETIIATSRVAPFLYKWREFIMMIPVIAIIYFGIYASDDE